PYLVKTFSKGRLEAFLEDYIRFVKEDFQGQYQGVNEVLSKVHLMVTSPPYFAALLQRPLAVARLERIFGGDAKNYVCKDCGRKRNLTPSLVCKKCGKDFSKRQKSKIIAKKNYTTKFRSVQVKSSRIESKGPRQATFQCEGLWEVERVFKLE
ncbi:MAG: hypothetical protein ACXQT6_02295, partial [Candidatus Methanospirareceae archaeon]